MREFLHSVPELFDRLSPSVFVVEALDGSGIAVAQGSGVAIAPDEVVTNEHVVREGISFRVKQGSQVWAATVENLDPLFDLCVLKVDNLRASYVEGHDPKPKN